MPRELQFTNWVFHSEFPPRFGNRTEQKCFRSPDPLPQLFLQIPLEAEIRKYRNRQLISTRERFNDLLPFPVVRLKYVFHRVVLFYQRKQTVQGTDNFNLLDSLAPDQFVSISKTKILNALHTWSENKLSVQYHHRP